MTGRKTGFRQLSVALQSRPEAERLRDFLQMPD